MTIIEQVLGNINIRSLLKNVFRNIQVLRAIYMLTLQVRTTPRPQQISLRSMELVPIRKLIVLQEHLDCVIHPAIDVPTAQARHNTNASES